jgi:hypothetical protein
VSSLWMPTSHLPRAHLLHSETSNQPFRSSACYQLLLRALVLQRRSHQNS